MHDDPGGWFFETEGFGDLRERAVLEVAQVQCGAGTGIEAA